MRGCNVLKQSSGAGISKFEGASRNDIDALLLDKLSSALNEEQKNSKIGNLLSKLRMNGVIHNAGTKGAPEWRLVR